MGGRGASFRAGGGSSVTAAVSSAASTPKTAKDYNDISSLRKYAKDELGIHLASTLDGCDYGLVQKAVEHYEFLKAEFPQWATMTGFRAKPLGASVNAQTQGNIVTFNANKFNDATKYNAGVARGEQTGWYPKGTTGDTTSIHEMGHTFEQAMIDKYMPGNTLADKWARTDAWNRGVYSKRIISEASKIAKKFPDGKGKLNAQLVGEVSKYAKTKSAETLAECVRDYCINKTNAQPLSRAVWGILKKEFG